MEYRILAQSDFVKTIKKQCHFWFMYRSRQFHHRGKGNTTLIPRHYVYNMCVELIQYIDEYTNLDG